MEGHAGCGTKNSCLGRADSQARINAFQWRSRKRLRPLRIRSPDTYWQPRQSQVSRHQRGHLQVRRLRQIERIHTTSSSLARSRVSSHLANAMIGLTNRTLSNQPQAIVSFFMSRSLIGRINLFENLWPCQLQEHQPSLRNAGRAPLRNRWRLDLTDARNLGCSAEGVDNCVCVGIHAPNLRRT